MPPTQTSPAVARSMPVIMFMSVDLPQPGLPDDRDELAGVHLEVDAAERPERPGVGDVVLDHGAQVDEVAAGSDLGGRAFDRAAQEAAEHGASGCGARGCASGRCGGRSCPLILYRTAPGPRIRAPGVRAARTMGPAGDGTVGSWPRGHVARHGGGDPCEATARGAPRSSRWPSSSPCCRRPRGARGGALALRKIEPRYIRPVPHRAALHAEHGHPLRSGYAAWMIDEALRAHDAAAAAGLGVHGAERKEGINARYFVAHAMLESGWGTSDIARLKRNLFGYGAYDRDPWRYATRFRTYRKGILAVAAADPRSLPHPERPMVVRLHRRCAASTATTRPTCTGPTRSRVLANQLDGLVVTLQERRLRFGRAELRRAPRSPGRPDHPRVPWTARRGRRPARRPSASASAGRRSPSSRASAGGPRRGAGDALDSSHGRSARPVRSSGWPCGLHRSRASGASTSRPATATAGPCPRPTAAGSGR